MSKAMSNRTPQEILAYCDAATPGPWRIDSELIEDPTSDEVGEAPNAIYAGSAVVFGIDDWDDGWRINHDAQFVANAREDLPRMAERVLELEKIYEAAKVARDCAYGELESKLLKLADVMDAFEEWEARNAE